MFQFPQKAASDICEVERNTFTVDCGDSCVDVKQTGWFFGLGSRDTWKPWKNESRISVAKQVESFKKSLEKMKMTVSTRRSKVTSFIAQKHSRQEFEPVIGKLIDQAHVDPLHLKNNACALAYRQLLAEVIAMSKVSSEIILFSQVPALYPFSKYVAVLQKRNVTRLAKKITKWFDETNGNGKHLTIVSRERIQGFSFC